MKLHNTRAILFAVGLLFSSTPFATTFSLGGLLNGGNITVGDKLFDNFSCTKAGTGTPGACGDINVNTLDTIDYGIEFQAGFFAAALNTVDFLLQFDVTVLDPSYLLNDVHLLFNGAVTGDGFANVVETITNLDAVYGTVNQFLAQIVVNTTNPPASLSASADLAYATKKIHVQKDVLLTGGNNGTSTISFIDQRFSQVQVPEPSTLLALLAGGLSFFSFQRTRKTRTL